MGLAPVLTNPYQSSTLGFYVPEAVVEESELLVESKSLSFLDQLNIFHKLITMHLCKLEIKTPSIDVATASILQMFECSQLFYQAFQSL